MGKIGMKITSTFANATADQCQNVKCVEKIEETRDNIVTGFGIATIFGGVISVLDLIFKVDFY